MVESKGLTIIWPDGTFYCPVHKQNVLHFCVKCYEEEKNVQMKQFIMMSRRMNWAIVKGAF